MASLCSKIIKKDSFTSEEGHNLSEEEGDKHFINFTEPDSPLRKMEETKKHQCRHAADVIWKWISKTGKQKNKTKTTESVEKVNYSKLSKGNFLNLLCGFKTLLEASLLVLKGVSNYT